MTVRSTPILFRLPELENSLRQQGFQFRPEGKRAQFAVLISLPPPAENSVLSITSEFRDGEYHYTLHQDFRL